MLDLVDLFPKTIGVTELETLTPEVIERAIEFIDLAESVDLGHDGGYTREQQILEKAFFREVKQEIIALCREFGEAYGHQIEEIGICNSWGNIVSRGESIRYHKHINSYISGSFYLTDGSPLNLLNTVTDDLFAIRPAIHSTDENFRSWESFNIPPKAGRIVLFPSGMHHCVMPSEHSDKRYSVAFNAIPLGRVGAPTNQMTIQLG